MGGQRTDPEAIQELLSSTSRTLLVAENLDGQLVGCVILERRSGAVAYLGMLTVDPTMQAQGLGKTLLTYGEQYARMEWAASSIEMTVITRRVELIAWYERQGYVRTGEKRPFPVGNSRFGIPQVADLEFEVLRKDLSP